MSNDKTWCRYRLLSYEKLDWCSFILIAILYIIQIPTFVFSITNSWLLYASDKLFLSLLDRTMDIDFCFSPNCHLCEWVGEYAYVCLCVSVFVCGAHKSVGNLVGEFILFRPFRPYDFCVLFVSVKYFGNKFHSKWSNFWAFCMGFREEFYDDIGRPRTKTLTIDVWLSSRKDLKSKMKFFFLIWLNQDP